MAITKKELLELVNQLPDTDDPVYVDGCIEKGLGYVGDTDCSFDIREEDGNWTIVVEGDDGCGTGYYE